MLVKDITRMALLLVILFVQEQILMAIPNVQLTVLLIIIYSRLLGFKKTTIIVFIYVIFDSMTFGGITLYYTPFMFLAWMIIPVGMSTVFRKVENEITLGFISILFSFLYSWILMIPSVLIFGIPFLTYLIADIPFEFILGASSFVSVIYLLKPLEKVIIIHLE